MRQKEAELRYDMYVNSKELSRGLLLVVQGLRPSTPNAGSLGSDS